MRHSVKLTANRQTQVPFSGRVLYIVSTGAAPTVDIEVTINGTDTEALGACANRYRFTCNDGETITSMLMLSTVDATVDINISDRDLDIQDGSGGTTSAVIDPASLPLPVRIDGATATVPVKDVTVRTQTATYSTANVTNAAAGVQLLAAGNYSRAIIHNSDAALLVGIYRGAGPVPFASCAVVLKPGETFIEDQYAGNGQAFRAIASAAGPAVVAVEVMA